MKKRFLIPALALAFVASGLSASACYIPTRSLLVVDNHSSAETFNNQYAKSNTGFNSITGASHATIGTGTATSANYAETQANMTTIEVSSPASSKTIIKNGSYALTQNNQTAKSNSGMNRIGGSVMPATLSVNGFAPHAATIDTGNAMSSNEAVTLVNSTTIRVH